MRWGTLLIGSFCWVVVTSHCYAGAEIAFRKIVDNSVLAPGGSSLFSSFRYVSIDGNNIAFTAESVGETLGVYSGRLDTSSINLIAKPNSPAGADGVFANIALGPVSALSGSNIIFFGNTVSGTNFTGAGIYAGTVGSTGASAVANYNTPWPTNPSLRILGYQGGPCVSGNKVVFNVRGTATTANGIFTATIGSSAVSVIADSTTPVPGQPVNFSPVFTSASPSISGENVAFYGRWTNGSTSGSGIYTGTAGVRGATLIADTTMNAPGTTSKFTLFGNAILNGTDLAYTGYFD